MSTNSRILGSESGQKGWLKGEQIQFVTSDRCSRFVMLKVSLLTRNGITESIFSRIKNIGINIRVYIFDIETIVFLHSTFL